MSLKNKIKEKYTVGTVALLVFLLAYIVVLVFPYLWALTHSLKSLAEVEGMTGSDANIIGLPRNWTFSNYIDVFTVFKVYYQPEGSAALEYPYYLLMMNSVVYSLCSALTTTLCTVMVAYATAQFPNKVSTLIDIIVLGTMAIPIVGNMASSLWVFKELGLYNNFFGMVFIAKFSFQNMYYFIIKNYIKNTPAALTESAQIDGATNFQVMSKVILPVIFPAILTVFIINFIGYWNDWQTPYVYLQSYPTAAYGLYALTHNVGAVSGGTGGITDIAATSPVVILPAVMLLALPVLIIFAIFGKRLMTGISVSGSVKE